MINPPGVWRIAGGGWQFWAPGYAVYGTVRLNKDNAKLFDWEARVMAEHRKDGICGPPPRGQETSLERAKTKVEDLLFQTNTCKFPVIQPS